MGMVNNYNAEFYKQVIEDAVDFAWDPEVQAAQQVDLFSLSDTLEFLEDEEEAKIDNVNSPSHYTQGKIEAIDVLEDAVRHAPDPVVGMLQAQCLKYLLRMWHKGNAHQDAEKSCWYLKRLIKALSNV